jgi:cellulose synthase/poly-beta-1,6-N-acetylglucosamine synthase-like glycosyltransferase
MLLDIYLYFILISAVCYIISMLACKIGWRRLAVFNPPQSTEPHTTISVLVAARNEAQHIENCLKSIAAQTYPAHLFEIIVINDHSEDATFALAKAMNIPNLRVLQLADYGVKGSKKKAIETGVGEATGRLIVTTDADCIVQPDWLTLIADFYELHQPKFIAAPVNFHQEKNTFESCQSLDFLGLMAVTGAGIELGMISMCNGANLAYERAVFYEVEGFKGIDQLASGDDMLLMQKIALKYPDKIAYLKNTAATVFTHAKEDWKSFISQRVRWASKTNSYKEFTITAVLIMVFFFCCNIPLSLFLSLFFGKIFLQVFVFQCLIKVLFDYFAISEVTTFFNRKDLHRVLFPAFWFHIGYVIVVGILASILFNYEWKGRYVR